MKQMLTLLLLCSLAPALGARVIVRPADFTVPPSTGPVTQIVVTNPSTEPCEVTVTPDFGPNWRWSPKQRTAAVAPGASERLAFTIDKAVDLQSNLYPVKVSVTSGSDTWTVTADVVCASAPYLKPKIDGDASDFADAIPITFRTDLMAATVSTAWNRDFFLLAVEVTETQLQKCKSGSMPVDAVQFAIAPRTAVTPSDPAAELQRHEFLLVPAAGMFAKDKCFRLARPGRTIAAVRTPDELDKLAFSPAQISVKRKGDVTTYECAIPFDEMPQIRPDTGREFRFSLLVHDGDETAIRDLGRFVRLPPTPLAWTPWASHDFHKNPPADSKAEWGLCSSKH